MPGTVVSIGHTLKHNTAAFSASGHQIERGGRRAELREAEDNKEKARNKNEQEQETGCAERNRGNMREEGGERRRNKG